METISPEYLEELKELHAKRVDFGAGAHQWTPRVMDLCAEYQTYDVLDYGCGKGTLAKSMPYEIKEYDPAIKGKDGRPALADVVVCTDVLEHIEPENLLIVLADLATLTKKVIFLVVATRKAVKELPSGRNAHLIVENGTWWVEQLEQHFRLVSHEWDGEELVVVGEPRGV